MNRPATSGFRAETPRKGTAKPSKDELAEARRVYDELLIELKTLVRERERFRKDLRQAVADGDKMMQELRAN